MNKKLLSKIRFYFAQCVFMNSIHYKACSRIDKKIERNRIIVVAIASITLLVIIIRMIAYEFEFDKFLSVLTFLGMLCTCAALMYSYFNKEDISIIKCQHKIAAENYKDLRDRLMSLIEEVMSIKNENEIRIKFKELLFRYGMIGKTAPSTTSTDYSDSQKGLGIGINDDEEFTWSDNEIDRFLPNELRLDKTPQ